MKEYRVWDTYKMSYQATPTEEFPCMKVTDQLDSKGQFIYECDILERKNVRGIVEYNEYDMRFFVRFGTELVYLHTGQDFTILGNAFENPELV